MSLKFIDLFAGAGGFGLGFKLADYEHLCSLEVDKWAVDTLRQNSSKEVAIVFNDIREYNTPEKILKCCSIKPDIIIGGPPCQGFSHAGPIKDPKDPRNSLFENYAKWVEVLSPKVFVMENVTGILNRENEHGEKVIDIIKQTFRNINYSVEVWVLNAAEYGVPQIRRRVFIVGNKFGREIGLPRPTHFLPVDSSEKELKLLESNLLPAVTVEAAISDLPVIYAREGSEIQPYSASIATAYQAWARRGSDEVYNHVAMDHTKRVVERFKAIMSGISKADLHDDYKVRKRNGNGELSDTDYNSNYRHLKGDMISYTIPASFYSNFIHPLLPRNITSREAARLQSFPDTYRFMGKRTQISKKLLKKLEKDEDHLSQYNQIGNAVPPLLAKAIASKIKLFLNETNITLKATNVDQEDSLAIY